MDLCLPTDIKEEPIFIENGIAGTKLEPTGEAVETFIGIDNQPQTNRYIRDTKSGKFVPNPDKQKNLKRGKTDIQKEKDRRAAECSKIKKQLRKYCLKLQEKEPDSKIACKQIKHKGASRNMFIFKSDNYNDFESRTEQDNPIGLPQELDEEEQTAKRPNEVLICLVCSKKLGSTRKNITCYAPKCNRGCKHLKCAGLYPGSKADLDFLKTMYFCDRHSPQQDRKPCVSRQEESVASPKMKKIKTVKNDAQKEETYVMVSAELMKMLGFENHQDGQVMNKKEVSNAVFTHLKDFACRDPENRNYYILDDGMKLLLNQERVFGLSIMSLLYKNSHLLSAPESLEESDYDDTIIKCEYQDFQEGIIKREEDNYELTEEKNGEL